MSAAPILTVLKEGETVKSCPIQGDIVLGRAEGCAIRLNDRAISREHALFKVMGNEVQVERKSEFGFLAVNGSECTRASLKEGDVVAIGPYLIRISNPSVEQKPVEPNPSSENASINDGNDGISESSPLASVSEPMQAPASFSQEAAPALELPPSEAELPQMEVSSSSPMESPSPDTPELSQPAEGAAELAGESNAEPAVESSVDSTAEPAAEAPSQPSQEVPPLEASEPSMELIGEDAKTKITPSAKVKVNLRFAPGTANYTSYDFTKNEISIGRGKDCDIVLNDKKASRKNTILRRAGLNFIIKDLDSANGTFVNGAKIQEQELSGDELIKVGGVEFQFKVLSSDYVAQEKGFMSLPIETEVQESFPLPDPSPPPGQVSPVQSGGGMLASPLQLGMPQGIQGGFNQVPGIVGMGSSSSGKSSLFEKYRALPKIQQNLVAVGVIAFLYWFMSDDPLDNEKKKASPKKPTPSASANPTVAPRGITITFESLPQDKKDFIVHQHDIAFDLYKNQEFDKALFEIRKIFDFIQDYSDSREIEKYALEGKRKREAIEEEKQKKKEAEQLKAKIVQMEETCRQKMGKKAYEEAKELFSQLLAIDPDNVKVAEWKKQVDAYEEDLKIQAQAKQTLIEIDKHGWNLYKEALALKKAKKYHSGIAAFQKVLDIGVADHSLIRLSKQMQSQCRVAIKNLRDPVLTEAKNSEDSGDLAKAFDLYHKATKIDPPHPAGYLGMNRVRGVLHDRAKEVYTEAILAESYSDFLNAKKLFKECLKIAPQDDIYYERAQRKLAHYFHIFKNEEGNSP